MLKRALLTVVLPAVLIGCVGRSPQRKQAVDSWQGQYRHVSGKYDLRINEEVGHLISVEIVDARNSANTPRSNFLAEKTGNVAHMKLARPDPDCQVELKRTAEGVFVAESCGGTGDDAGLYRSVE